jgi:hypothetical protein
VLPVLLLLVIGMLEFSLLMRDWLGLSSSVRVGARIAATGAGAGEVTDCTDKPASCVTGIPNLVEATAIAITQAGTAMPKNSIDELWVYQANNSGFPTNTTPTSANGWNNNGDGATTEAAALAAGCHESCIRYIWSDAFGRFVFPQPPTYAAGSGGHWNAKLINACINDVKGQSVGVYMKATHPLVTKLFGASFGLKDRSVMKFEPLPPKDCQQDAHS